MSASVTLPKNTFRFSDNYEDVFVEDDHYIYACAEPFGWPYLLAANEYHEASDHALIRHDGCGASLEYLQMLTPAKEHIAKRIIACENKRTREIEKFLAYTETPNGGDSDAA